MRATSVTLCRATPHLASLIFEGVFDRYPTLKVSLLETNWSWLAPYAWRLDASWRVPA